jgi:predicted ATPase
MICNVTTAASRVFLRGVTVAPGIPTEGFPFDMPVVQHVGSIDFAPVTVFAGDNGTPASRRSSKRSRC